VRRFPALLEAIAAGELHLTGLLMLGPQLTAENLTEVLARAKHRTPYRNTLWPMRSSRSTGSANQQVSGWAQQGLNLRLRPCEGRTLPLSYAPGGRAF
jgi:hypothetical protein